MVVIFIGSDTSQERINVYSHNQTTYTGIRGCYTNVSERDNPACCLREWNSRISLITFPYYFYYYFTTVSCVTRDEVFHLSMPQGLHLYNGDNRT